MKWQTGNIKTLALLSLILGLSCCVDPIPFQAEEEIPKLVIFGSYSQQSQDHEVIIQQTNSFGKAGVPVGGAIVEVISEEGERGQYIEMEEGTYILPKNTLCGEPGKAYKLSVALGNQRKFESSWEILTEPIQVQNTRFEVNLRPEVSASNVLIEQFYIDILIDTPLKTTSGDKAYLRWEVDEVFSILDFSCGPFDKAEICFYKVDEKFNDLQIFTSLDDSQERLENYRVFFRLPTPHLEFSERHYFNVTQYSISESAYNYWEKIEVVTNPSGSIFDKLPASVPGNIEQVNGDLEVLGFFEVASVSIGRVDIFYYELNESFQFPEVCNPYYPPFFQPDFCCYCWVLPNLIPRPDYWGE